MNLRWSRVADDKSLAELLDALRAGAKEARQVTLGDLALPPDACTGVYFFFEGDDLAYVGRSASRAFIERVPSHFDARAEGWFGTLLKKLAHPRQSPDDSVLARGLGMRLALLQVDDPDADPGDLEELFRHAYGPKLNTPKKRRTHDLSRKPVDLL